MVSPDIQRISHIKTYCEDIARSIERFGGDYQTFSSDKDFFNSVSMSIMQIGELVGGLSDEFRENTKAQMQWGAIRGMRNLFAHTYAKMDKTVIWDVASRDIPGLLQFCNNIIEKSLETGEKPSVLEKLREGKEAADKASQHNIAKNSPEK